MIEAVAEAAGRPVSRETFDRLRSYSDLLRETAGRQNLISDATLDCLWERHILDSAQLARFEPQPGASWVDIGSGAGLPGMVLAILVAGPVFLIEPRRLRVAFLNSVVDHLHLGDRVKIVGTKAESVEGRFDVITARAVAPADKLLKISTHLSTRNSMWVLPKGRSAESELAEVRRHWHCDAEAVPSLTDPESGILLLRNVKARGGR
jgi:16S rRNA (guanine527-N7)-methyltransferase